MISSNVHSESSEEPPSFTIYPSHQKTRCLWNSCYDGQAQCEREGQDQKAEMLDEILDTRLHKTQVTKHHRTPLSIDGNFVAAKNNAKQIMGSYWIHGCLLYNFWISYWSHSFLIKCRVESNLWIRPRCDTDDQHQAGKKVTTSIAIRKLRFCQLHEKKIAAGSRGSSFMVSSHETSWK